MNNLMTFSIVDTIHPMGLKRLLEGKYAIVPNPLTTL
jgi:hypothetical protein